MKYQIINATCGFSSANAFNLDKYKKGFCTEFGKLQKIYAHRTESQGIGISARTIPIQVSCFKRKT